MRSLSTFLRLSRQSRRPRLPRWMRRGLVVLTGVALVAGYFATVAHLSRNGWVDQRLAEGQAWVSQTLAEQGFRVEHVQAHGLSWTEASTLRDTLGEAFGEPMLDVELSRLRLKAEALPWVRVASVERQWPNRLVVRVLERVPMALLQRNGALALVDHSGAVIEGTSLAPFAELPIITGEKAEMAAPALQLALATEPSLAARVTGATFLGERRWDVRIDDRVWIRLPESEAAAAWQRLAVIDAQHGILRRNILSVDLRDPRQWAFRLASGERERISSLHSGS